MMTSPLAGWLVVVIGSFLPYPAPLHSTPLHLIPVSILINAEVTLLLDTSRKRFFVAVSFVDRYIHSRTKYPLSESNAPFNSGEQG